MPPPITSRPPEDSGSSSAPVESMMRGSSGRPGKRTDSEPAAMMHCSKRMRCAPLVARDLEHVRRSTNVPVPRTTSTLRCFASIVEAAGELADDLALPLAQLVADRSAARRRRCRARSSRAASSMTLAACSSAFDGMQPTLRHTPPSSASARPASTLQAEIGGAECRGVAAGAGAEHEQLRAAAEVLRGARRRCRAAGAGMRTVSPAVSVRAAGAGGGPAGAGAAASLAGAAAAAAAPPASTPHDQRCPWRPCRRASAAPR